MGRKPTPGLYYRKGVWIIDKHIYGERVQQSTRETNLELAEEYLANLIRVRRQSRLFGKRQPRTFEEAAVKFVEENGQKRSLKDDIGRLRGLLPSIGQLPISDINMQSLQPWIAQRKRQKVSVGTINHGLTLVRRILNLAATEWLDNDGLTWLEHPPKIKLLSNTTRAKPSPLSWEEQDRLFHHLPDHLRLMALFAVNTGCRDAEICNLRWDWELKIGSLNTSIFVVPDQIVKNGHDRLVVLNHTALAAINDARGVHHTYVFTYKGQPITRMNNTAWRTARKNARLPNIRVHDLKHTFGRRLRAAGVSFEDRQDLLGHKAQRITTHYSAAEIGNLISAADLVADSPSVRERVVLLNQNTGGDPCKIPASKRTQTINLLLSH